MTIVEKTENPVQNTTEQWFDELVSTLRTHQLMIETQTIDEDKKKFYDILQGSNTLEVSHLSRTISQRQIIGSILWDYLKIIKDNKPQKLAFDYNDSEVLVWAEIDENNEQLEKQLYLAEAQINAKYHQYGFDMTSMIVENTDNITTPNHYKPFVG
jgi:tRNA A22 N-methylase